MDTLSIKAIGKEIQYIQPDILMGGEQRIYTGTLKKIYKRGLYGYCIYLIKARNNRLITKNELQVWKAE